MPAPHTAALTTSLGFHLSNLDGVAPLNVVLSLQPGRLLLYSPHSEIVNSFGEILSKQMLTLRGFHFLRDHSPSSLT